MANKYVEKYNKTGLGKKEKLAVAIGAVMVVILYFMFFHKDTTPYGYAVIPDKLHEYLQSADNYSKDYNEGKMFVLYYNERDKENPYSKAFKDAVASAQRNKKVSELYSFKTFTMLNNNVLFDGKEGEAKIKGEDALKKVCRKFCIVNPGRKAVYFYYMPKARDIQYLESNLEKLEYWGAKLD